MCDKTKLTAQLSSQSTGFVLTAAGYILGHSHAGRMFPPSIHGTFALILLFIITLQLSLGIYLKLHIHEQSIRPWAVRAHGMVGKAYPIFGWTQMVLGVATFRSYCRGDNLGQCLAHYIMVSSQRIQGNFALLICTRGAVSLRTEL
jgi:hypothetical protein